SNQPPSGPPMKTMFWIPSVMDEPGTHCPVSSQMYACLVSTLTPSAPRQPPDPLPTRVLPLTTPGDTVAVVGGVPGGEPGGGGTSTVGLTVGDAPTQPLYSPPDAPPPRPQVMSPTSRPHTALAFLSALST